jgi:hypothetical protein
LVIIKLNLDASLAMLRVHPLHGGDGVDLLHDHGEDVLHLVQLLVTDLVLYGDRPHPLLYAHCLGLILLGGIALILALLILLLLLLFILQLI